LVTLLRARHGGAAPAAAFAKGVGVCLAADDAAVLVARSLDLGEE
jgi:hypothetical protein